MIGERVRRRKSSFPSPIPHRLSNHRKFEIIVFQSRKAPNRYIKTDRKWQTWKKKLCCLLPKFLVFLFLILSFFSQDYPILWGICAPKQCSEEDVTNALQIFSGTFTSSQKLTWIIETGTCLPDKKPPQNIWRILHARARIWILS